MRDDPKVNVDVLQMPDEPCHCTLLRKAGRNITAFYDRALGRTGLRVTQYAVLAEVARSGPMSISDLAKALVMDRNGLGHTINTLERDGYLTIVPGRDRRSRAVSLSPAGRQRLSEAKPYWSAAQQKLTASGLFEGLSQPLSMLAACDLDPS